MKDKPEKNTTVTSFCCKPSFKEYVKERAMWEGMSVSEFIRTAIRFYVGRPKKGAK